MTTRKLVPHFCRRLPRKPAYSQKTYNHTEAAATEDSAAKARVGDYTFEWMLPSRRLPVNFDS